MVRPSHGDSIRQKVLKIWSENPHIKAKEVCRILNLEYTEHGPYVNNRLSEYRSHYSIGSPLELHRRIFEWKYVPRLLLFERLRCREEDVGPGFKALGWEMADNRNRMLVFRHEYGSVHWFKGGKVILFLRGPASLSRAKELFCKVFSWFDPKELCKYVDAPLREESKQWVFDVGAPVPPFDIRTFKQSHGIRIYTDKSHKRAIEVEETRPFWLDEFRDTVSKFGEEIGEHMKLIGEWREEARTGRIILAFLATLLVLALILSQVGG